MTTRRRTKRARQGGLRYEDETSVRSAKGTVTVAEGVWWFGEVVVPMTGDCALIQVERRPESTGPSDANLAVPVHEIDAVLTLLRGMVAQARRDGVLPPQRATSSGGGTAAARRRRRSARSVQE